jgi:serine protease Do
MKLTLCLSVAAIFAVLMVGNRGAPRRRGFDFEVPSGPSAVAGEAAAEVASAKELSRAFVAASGRARPAVVHIQVERKVLGAGGYNDPFDLFNDEFFRRFFGPRRRAPRERVQRGQGSGVIVDRAGYILTNNHVVGDADKITVKLADKREFEAKLVGADERSDVAVVKIEGKDLPVAPTGDSDALRVGEWVIAIGNPFGLEQTVTAGVVSAKGRSQVVDIQYQDFIQTDAAINPGNSGGPMVDLDGRVVGINTAIFSRSGGYMGIGFAIPINMAVKIMKSFVKHGRVVRGWLGVMMQNVDEDMAKVLGLPGASGAMITEVVAGGPAAAAGLKERDVIVRFDTREITSINDLFNAVGFAEVGGRVEVEFYRGGKKRTAEVKVAERTAEVEADEAGGERLEKLGITVEDLDAGKCEKLGLKEGQTGVVVTAVKPGSFAAEKGFRPGMVITQAGETPVGSVEDLRKALGSDRDRVLIKILYRGEKYYTVLRLK